MGRPIEWLSPASSRILSAAVIVLAFVAWYGRPSPDETEDLISGIGLTHLTVYDQRAAPDGRMSGSPHVHAVTDEGYYVISGRGQVELHDLENGFRTVDLEPGRYVQVPPGTLHRLVSTDHLVLLVVMGSAGLAERGDARVYFGKAVDENPAEFERLSGLAKAKGLEGALDRRDAAVRAYMSLVELWTNDQPAYYTELARFIRVHLKAASCQVSSFGRAVERGPMAWGLRFRKRLEKLPGASEEAGPVLHVPTGETALGMCGVLRPVTTFEPVGPAQETGKRK
jgi:mannose-6-phosphate isomerase-like protein (cupin superfamily)